MDRRTIAMLVAALLSACGSPTETNLASNQSAPDENAATPLSPPAPGTPGGLPDDRTPLEEPKGPIDPKSVEAAGQVVQHYGALIEQGRWTASRELWSVPEAAKAFELNFRTAADVHVEIGDLEAPGGAAGSIYVSQPVTFYGHKNGGGEYRRAAVITLRRANDVPGSTESQRRWHIERIEWKDAA